MNDKIVITSYTDPLCTWCWGSEPVFRALETHYPDQIEFRYVMGGLVRDILDFNDVKNGIGVGGVDEINSQIASHWFEASAYHGMPVSEFKLFDEEYRSTYPLNIACKAAYKASPELGERYLYNLRLASAAEGRKTVHKDELISIASETGIDVVKFMRYLEEDAEKEFSDDLKLMKSNHVTGFPNFEITYKGRTIKLKGYNVLESFKLIISSLTGGEIEPVEVEASNDNLLSFMQSHPVMAFEEIRQAFDLNFIDEVEDLVNSIDEVSVEKIGNGYFARLNKHCLVCDIETGICE